MTLTFFLLLAIIILGAAMIVAVGTLAYALKTLVAAFRSINRELLSAAMLTDPNSRTVIASRLMADLKKEVSSMSRKPKVSAPKPPVVQRGMVVDERGVSEL